MLPLRTSTKRIAVHTLLCLPMLASRQAAYAQEQEEERQGNIVEYFGKEKVEDINEGKLVHVFQKGLVLGLGRGFGFARRESTPIDRVMARFLFRQPTGVDADRVFDVDSSGQPMRWEEIEVDDKSTFQDRRLRSGVLYLSYTSETDQTVLLDASGHTRLLVDGMPHDGDHYDFGWQLIPLHLTKGKHEFVLQGGRFDRMRARLIEPDSLVRFTNRDVTLPDIRRGEAAELWGAIRVINATDVDLDAAAVECRVGDLVTKSAVPRIATRTIRKAPFLFPPIEVADAEKEQVEFELELFSKSGESLAQEKITLNVRSPGKHHKRTFLSDVDGSVQYYSLAPCTDPE
ncbi:MAG: hypothetical protein AAF961_05500, partial [Planctomycetota bacterium]